MKEGNFFHLHHHRDNHGHGFSVDIMLQICREVEQTDHNISIFTSWNFLIRILDTKESCGQRLVQFNCRGSA